MDLKVLAVVCLLVFSTFFLGVSAQRDGRRRSGRRKPTTEAPKEAMEEPESEASPQNVDIAPEPLAKPTHSQPAESLDSLSTEKEATNPTSGGPPFIVPRGTRKPRPMQVRNNGEARPKPTLPTFSRKNNRRPKPERHDFKKLEENTPSSVPISTTTAKPSRNSSRRRGGHSSQSDRNSNLNRDSQVPAPSSSSEAAPKKRFGGATRKPSRGSRRSTTVPSVE
ncbi:translation initiation factor IF-2-like [Uloborus diversus]|uniref:translation initiation factor IF-2-like n=1 Tax=Uloborus diversus TaxID=327109 RepID=UPI002409A2C8|nr:translation initiation factor IF-2-like [Uloborus diversus]